MAVSSILSAPTPVTFSKPRPVKPVSPMVSVEPVTSTELSKPPEVLPVETVASTEPLKPPEVLPVETSESRRPVADIGGSHHYMPSFDGCKNCKIKIVFKQ